MVACRRLWNGWVDFFPLDQRWEQLTRWLTAKEALLYKIQHRVFIWNIAKTYTFHFQQTLWIADTAEAQIKREGLIKRCSWSPSWPKQIWYINVTEAAFTIWKTENTTTHPSDPVITLARWFIPLETGEDMDRDIQHFFESNFSMAWEPSRKSVEDMNSWVESVITCRK